MDKITVLHYEGQEVRYYGDIVPHIGAKFSYRNRKNNISIDAATVDDVSYSIENDNMAHIHIKLI